MQVQSNIPQLPAPEPQLLLPAPAGRRGATDGVFTAGEAMHHMGDGAKHALTGMWDQLRDRPLRAAGIVGGLVGATALLPGLATGLLAVSAAMGLWEFGTGTAKVVKRFQAGEPDAAEKAFKYIGHALATMAVTGVAFGAGKLLGSALNASVRGAKVAHAGAEAVSLAAHPTRKDHADQAVKNAALGVEGIVD